MDTAARIGELDDLALAITAHLQEPFRLWLVGDMGAGKTTLTRFLLWNLGLPRIVPVTSPTYTYVNEYRLGHRLIAHVDLYRTAGEIDPGEFGLGSEPRYTDVIIEWPELGSTWLEMKPTHTLAISGGDDPSQRHYRLLAHREN